LERVRSRLRVRAARAAGARHHLAAFAFAFPDRGRRLMQFFAQLGEVPAGFGPSAVTVGKFDGLHTGHRAVLERLRASAAEHGLASTVVTFDRNPLALLAPERSPASLVSNAQKRELLAEAGVDATL